MKSGNPQLVAMMIADPERACGQIRAALRKHKGSVTDAARELSITRRSLTRWIAAHRALAKEVKEARTQ